MQTNIHYTHIGTSNQILPLHQTNRTKKRTDVSKERDIHFCH